MPDDIGYGGYGPPGQPRPPRYRGSLLMHVVVGVLALSLGAAVVLAFGHQAPSSLGTSLPGGSAVPGPDVTGQRQPCRERQRAEGREQG